VFKGLFDATSYMDLRRLPELYCGFQRGRQRGPTLYPVACSPQAWAAGTPLMLLQSSLGLEFDQDRHEILLRHPRLPGIPRGGDAPQSASRKISRGFDPAPARQRRIDPGAAQRGADQDFRRVLIIRDGGPIGLHSGEQEISLRRL
jgi:hypothetical protein